MGKVLTPEELKKKRLEEGRNLLERVQKGEVIQGNAFDTNFQPRPVVQKDEKEMKRLYGKEEENK